MDIPKEYAVLVINTQKPQGQSVYALADSLFRKLNKIMTAKIPLVSVSIHPETLDSQQNLSYSIRIKSSRSTKLLIFREFFFPVAPHPSTKAYLLWTSRSAIRAWVYLWHKVPEIWREAVATHNRISGARMIAGEIIGVAFETLFLAYTISFITLTLIPFLRRISTVAFVSYFFLAAFAIVLLVWKQTLLHLITLISQLSHQLVRLIPESGLTFEILFPVIAAAFLVSIVAIFTILVRTARWIINKLGSDQEANLRTMSELSYLFDPLYSAKVRDDFEQQLIDLGRASNLRRIFIVCDGMGALLSYEVLSHNYVGKISTPVSLLTHHLNLAGLWLNPYRSLWLLVDPIDWGRFSKATPRNLPWWHCRIGWPMTGEYVVRLTSRPGHKFPQVKHKIKKHLWFKGTNTILADCLIERLLQLTKS